MKRRNFLASLFALPFAAKPLEAMAHMREYTKQEVARQCGELFGGIFDSHKRAVTQNTKAIQALTEALIYAPDGFKKGGRYRYGAD